MLELPSNNVVPLVELERQVAIRLNPAGVGRVHDCLTSGTNGDWLGEICLTGLGHPGDLGREVGDVVLFALQCGFGDEYREVAVVDANVLDLLVEEFFDLLPDEVGPGAKDVAAGDVVVLD